VNRSPQTRPRPALSKRHSALLVASCAVAMCGCAGTYDRTCVTAFVYPNSQFIGEEARGEAEWQAVGSATHADYVADNVSRILSYERREREGDGKGDSAVADVVYTTSDVAQVSLRPPCVVDNGDTNYQFSAEERVRLYSGPFARATNVVTVWFETPCPGHDVASYYAGTFENAGWELTRNLSVLGDELYLGLDPNQNRTFVYELGKDAVRLQVLGWQRYANENVLWESNSFYLREFRLSFVGASPAQLLGEGYTNHFNFHLGKEGR
jgi:hypothetical protein